MNLKKDIEQLKRKGVKSVYINSINLNVKSINDLKNMISKGELIPCKEDLEKMIKPEYHEQFYKGLSICLQCTYEIVETSL